MRLQRPSHTTVIAYLALFIALSGTAIAAKKIGSDGLRKGAVTTKKIADGAVATSKLKDDAVTGAKLDNGAVGENKLAGDAVTAGKLAQNSVGTNKIRDEAVESAKIANGAVTEAKIGNDAVIGSKVAPGSLDLTDYARAVVDISPTPAPPFNSGSCQQLNVAAPAVQAGDLPLVLQPVPTPDPRIQAVSVTAGVAGQLDVLLCNFSGANVVAPPAVPLRIALLR